jgi:hypothetical protein
VTEKAYQQQLDTQIKELIEKVSEENHVVKENGKRLKPFKRIKLKGKGPTTTEIIVEGRR